MLGRPTKSTLKALLERRGAWGVITRPFEEFDDEIRESLTSQAGLIEEEQPVIVCFRDKENWVLISDARLIWSESASHHSVAVSDIVKVTADLAGDAQSGARTKNDLHHLVIRTSNGETHRVNLEPGPPFFGVWNVVMFMAARRPDTS
jgi:hypothetical protein